MKKNRNYPTYYIKEMCDNNNQCQTVLVIYPQAKQLLLKKKRVYKIDPDTREIKGEYSSVSAAKTIGGIGNHIYKSINSLKQEGPVIIGGYLWFYVKEYDELMQSSAGGAAFKNWKEHKEEQAAKRREIFASVDVIEELPNSNL